jgi:hypothetical protein
MLSSNFKFALKTVNDLLTKHNIKWVLCGQTNMQLQGMDVSPSDLDIIVQLKDLNKVRSTLSEYAPTKIVELKPLVSEPAWEIKATICSVEVQIIGERDTGEYVRQLLANKLVKIKFDDVEIPCYNLETEAKLYEFTHRKHKAEFIRTFLNSK